MPTNMIEARINMFRNAYTPAPESMITLAEAIEAIRRGRYQRHVCEVRHVVAAQGKRVYDKAKGNLPAFTFGGTFSPSRAIAHLQQHSGIVHGDLDHLDDLASATSRLAADPHVVYSVVSPSATGLKHGVRVLPVDDVAYKHVWQAIADDCAAQYGFVLDRSGKDISRLCYVSWDPDAYWNPDAAVCEVPPPPIRESPAPTSLQPSPPTRTIARSDAYVVRAIKTTVQMIQTAPLGTRHHTRLRAARILWGYVVGGFLSYDQAYTVPEQALNGHTEDIAAALKTVKDGLAYGQAYPITLQALEDERQAWLAAHRPISDHGQPRQHLSPGGCPCTAIPSL